MPDTIEPIQVTLDALYRAHEPQIVAQWHALALELPESLDDKARALLESAFFAGVRATLAEIIRDPNCAARLDDEIEQVLRGTLAGGQALRDQ